MERRWAGKRLLFFMLGFLSCLNFYWHVHALIPLLFIKFSFRKGERLKLNKVTRVRKGVLAYKRLGQIYRQRTRENRKILKTEEISGKWTLVLYLSVPLPTFQRTLTGTYVFLNRRTSLPSFSLLKFILSLSIAKATPFLSLPQS